MKHSTCQEEASSRTCQLAEQEEASACQVTSAPKALGKVTVDAGEPKPVVERQQEEGDDNKAGKEAQAHLYVGHRVLMHPAWHADKAHTADACPYHAKGNEQPRRLPACTKESVVVAL